MASPSAPRDFSLTHRVLLRATFALGIPTGLLAQPFSSGTQFQVNSYTSGFQAAPAAAPTADGGFIVVWESHGSSGGDDSGTSIQGQRYDALGDPVGTEFQINDYSTGSQSLPAVAANADGDFLVVWQSFGSPGGDTSDFSVQARLFDEAGVPQGASMQVNQSTTGIQGNATVAARGPAGFIVAWQSYFSPGSDTDWRIVARHVDSSGAPVGGEAQVNTDTLAIQRYARVAALESGEFVVVWENASGSDGDGWSVQAQRFDTTGTPAGGEFRVNTHTTGNPYEPDVAVGPGGEFVVVWRSPGSFGDDPDASIQGQRFDSAGTALGTQFQVNTFTIGAQARPAVRFRADGSFLVTWESTTSPGSDPSQSIQALEFAADGTPRGDPLQVNSYTTGAQLVPGIAIDLAGRSLVIWSSDGSFGDDDLGWSIQARRFDGLFRDGFESGDSLLWSATSP